MDCRTSTVDGGSDFTTIGCFMGDMEVEEEEELEEEDDDESSESLDVDSFDVSSDGVLCIGVAGCLEGIDTRMSCRLGS